MKILIIPKRTNVFAIRSMSVIENIWTKKRATVAGKTIPKKLFMDAVSIICEWFTIIDKSEDAK